MEITLSLFDIIPAELINTISEKHIAATVLQLHPSETFPGREKNIGLWAELSNGRGIAITTNRKTGNMKIVVVMAK